MANPVNNFRQLVARRHGQVKAMAAFTLQGELMEATPVDTGRARASWNVSKNVPDLSVAPEGAKLKRKKVRADGNIRRRRMVRQRQQTLLQGVTPQDVLHVSNNLPYIERLNEGSSIQAPRHFVQAAVQRTAQQFDGIVADISRRGR